MIHHVCLNAFSRDAHGNESYTDEPAETVGWSVYVRTEPDAGGAFEVDEDHDVATRDGALRLAETLARKWGTTDIREY